MSRLPPIGVDDWTQYTAQRFRTRALRQIQRDLPPLPDRSLPPPAAVATRPASPPVGAPSPASTAASAAAVAPAPRPEGGYRPTQLTMPSAMAACGPAAALAFAARTGRTPTAAEAIELARQVGWNPSDGMAGPASEKALLDKMGIPAKLEKGVDWAKVRADVEAGNPVIIDTPGHYFVAEGYDPATGKFDFGTSATDLKGGSRFMTPDQLNATRMGPARSSLYLDNPDPATGPSVATGPQTPIQSEATATPDEIKGYVRAAAVARGIDPTVALRAADTEGGTNEPARRGTFATGSSWYPFQLHYGGPGYEHLGSVAGMGNSFTAETGWEPGDPNAWKASVDYALDGVAKNGWGAFYGPQKIGITGRTGLAPDARPLGVDPANLPGAPPRTPLIAPEPPPAAPQSDDWMARAQASVDALETNFGGLLPKPTETTYAPQERAAPDFAALAQAQVDALAPAAPRRAPAIPFYRPTPRPVPEAVPEPAPVEPPPPTGREADFYGPDALYGAGPAPAPYEEPGLPQRAAEAAGGLSRAIGGLVPSVTPPAVVPPAYVPPPITVDTSTPQPEELPRLGPDVNVPAALGNLGGAIGGAIGGAASAVGQTIAGPTEKPAWERGLDVGGAALETGGTLGLNIPARAATAAEQQAEQLRAAEGGNYEDQLRQIIAHYGPDSEEAYAAADVHNALVSSIESDQNFWTVAERDPNLRKNIDVLMAAGAVATLPLAPEAAAATLASAGLGVGLPFGVQAGADTAPVRAVRERLGVTQPELEAGASEVGSIAPFAPSAALTAGRVARWGGRTLAEAIRTPDWPRAVADLVGNLGGAPTAQTARQIIAEQPEVASTLARTYPVLDGPELQRSLAGISSPDAPVLTIAHHTPETGLQNVPAGTTWDVLNVNPERLVSGAPEDSLYLGQIPRSAIAPATMSPEEALRLNRIALYDPERGTLQLLRDKAAIEVENGIADPTIQQLRERVAPLGKQLESVAATDVPLLRTDKPRRVPENLFTAERQVHPRTEIADEIQRTGADPTPERLREIARYPAGRKWENVFDRYGGTPVTIAEVIQKAQAVDRANPQVKRWYQDFANLFKGLGVSNEQISWLASLFGETASGTAPEQNLQAMVSAANAAADLYREGKLTRENFVARMRQEREAHGLVIAGYKDGPERALNKDGTPKYNQIDGLYDLTTLGLRNTGEGSPKVSTYAKTIRERAFGKGGEFLPIIDRWIYRALGIDPIGTRAMNAGDAVAADYASGVIQEAARQLRWAPDEVQAALWFATRPADARFAGTLQSAIKFTGRDELRKLAASLRELDGRVPGGLPGVEPRLRTSGWGMGPGAAERSFRAGESLPATGPQVLGGAIRGGIAGGGAAAQEPEATPGDIAKGAALGAARGAISTRLPLGARSNLARIAEDVRRPGVGRTAEEAASEAAAAGRGAGGRPPSPVGGAAAAGGEEPSAAAREFAGNIRLGKYAEDVQPVIEAAYDANPAAFERARRGVVPDAETLAKAAGVKVEQVVKRWDPGKAENAETVIALRETLSAQARAVQEAQAAARAVDSSENVAKLTEELTKYRALQETVAGVTAEAGRALRAFRQPVTGELGDQMLARMLRLTAKDDLGAARKLLLDGLDLSDPVAVANAAKQLYQPTAWEKLRALWMNSLLSGPPGRIRDFLSSAYSVGTAPLEQGAAVPIDVAITAGRRAAQALRGKPVTAKRSIYAAEIPAQYAGYASAHNDAFRDAMRMIKHGFTPEQAARGDIEHIARREVLPGALNLPGRLVGANDVYWKGMSMEGASRAWAINQAKSQGLRGRELGTEVERLLKERPQAMIDHATTVAKYRSFQSDSDLAKWLAGMKNAPGPFAKGLTAVMPFHSTAIALAKWAMERTPLGFAMLGKDAVSGKLTQRQLSEGLARAGLGSAFMLEGYNLANDNRLTGAPPQDPNERDAFYRQHPPYSVRIGDRWHSYQFAPFAPLLAMSATIKSAVDKGETDNAAALWTAGALGAGKAMLDQPFLTGLQQFSEALDQPDRKFEAYAESWGRAAVPQVIQTVARATDNILRDPQGPHEAALTGIPGASRLIPARQDAWGRDVVREPSGPGVLDPFRTAGAKDDPVERELARLQLKDLKVEPGFIGPTQTLGKEDVKLSREQRSSEQRISGKIAYAVLAGMVGGPEWQAMSDDRKEEVIHKVYGQARTAARDSIKPQLVEPAIRQVLDRARREAAGAGAPG